MASVLPAGAGLTENQAWRIRRHFTTLPVLPNSFPYNEMLFRGLLKLGRFGVKTRSWNWHQRGLVLLYTSTSTHRIPAKAYDLDPKKYPRCVIVGVGELVDVRDLTEAEKKSLLCQFNNATPKQTKTFGQWGGPAYVAPLGIGFFFRRLKRFKTPVPFKPKQGAVRTFGAPLSLVAGELRRVGIDPKSI